MRFLKHLFGPEKIQDPPELTLGRYTDAFKSKEQVAHWERALKAHEKGAYLDACRSIMEYLSNGGRSSVTWEEKDGTLHFQIRQGSQRISGCATPERVRAESRLAQADTLSVGFMRRLMEYNYELKFCRFALAPDNALTLCFETAPTDASPLKVVSALRELAIWADKHDDLLLDEFSVLTPAEALRIELPAAEKEAKYHFICKEIRAAFDLMDKNVPKMEQHPGAYAYLLLAVVYRLDYLTRPEGFIMDVLERASRMYFAQEGQNIHLRVMALRRELQKVLDRPREQVVAELYRTESAFGVAMPLPFERLTQLIENEKPAMDWPLEQGYETLAMAVPQYIVSHTLFQYVPPKPVYELFRLFMRVTETDFFRSLGLQTFVGAYGQLDRRAVLAAVEDIVARNQAEFPRLKPETRLLDFTSMPRFAKTFLEMICRLDLTTRQR
ncbi:MAG: hypothetical protein RMJ33_09950 [Saprospiraceae bacterium]|nr:YbjN domain-containing protein [Saprospiraceae bacterium]MDW8230147.1 hypothetical protein [Saprospiraceae bacterium]